MYCNHRAYEVLLSIVILVFALWNSTISWLPSKWVIVVAAALLLIHAFSRKRLSMPSVRPKMSRAKPARKKVKKKRR